MGRRTRRSMPYLLRVAFFASVKSKLAPSPLLGLAMLFMAVSAAAVQELGLIAPRDRAIQESLFASLEDPNPLVRVSTIGMLARSSPMTEEVVRRLTALASNSDRDVGGEAVDALAELSDSVFQARDSLLALYPQADKTVRVRILGNLHRQALRDPRMLPILRAAAMDTSAHLREIAISDLTSCGPKVIPDLADILLRGIVDPDKSVRRIARRGLDSIPTFDESAMPALQQAVRDSGEPAVQGPRQARPCPGQKELDRNASPRGTATGWPGNLNSATACRSCLDRRNSSVADAGPGFCRGEQFRVDPTGFAGATTTELCRRPGLPWTNHN